MSHYHLQILRGTPTKASQYTGLPGELVYSHDHHNNNVFIHDGVTTGGHQLANKSEIPTKLSQLINDENYITNGGSVIGGTIEQAKKDQNGNVINEYYAPIVNSNLRGIPKAVDLTNIRNYPLDLYSIEYDQYDEQSGGDHQPIKKALVTLEYLKNTSSLVHTKGDEVIDGAKTFNENINGTAFRALWGDVAEYYLADKVYPAGTLVKFGGSAEITVADDVANAVVSTQPGIIINNNCQEKGTLIALGGRVPVLVNGVVHKFDKLTLDKSHRGVATVATKDDCRIIAIALKDKLNEDIDTVECVTKLDF